MLTSFTNLLGNFIMGVVTFPPILMVIYFFYNQVDPQQFQTDINTFLEFLNKYPANAWLFTAIAAILCGIAGIFLDFLGHIIIDEHILKYTRYNLISEEDRKHILSENPRLMESSKNKEEEFGKILESYFYTHAPEHLLQYHSETWSYCEFSRNAMLTSVIYLISGVLLFVRFQWAGCLLIWILFWILIIYLSKVMLKATTSYYYRIETVFAIGWLREKGLLKSDGASE